MPKSYSDDGATDGAALIDDGNNVKELSRNSDGAVSLGVASRIGNPAPVDLRGKAGYFFDIPDGSECNCCDGANRSPDFEVCAAGVGFGAWDSIGIAESLAW